MIRSFERRARHRRAPQLVQTLVITQTRSDGERRKLAAKLVDFSEQGVGLEMFAPLRVGSVVELDGCLQSTDLALSLAGRAKVIHAKRQKHGPYRIGLQIEEIAYRRPA
jgi:hypothetical protein